MEAPDIEKYEQAKEFAKNYFRKNRTIFSVCLGEIHFNSSGFMHLIWKNLNKKHKRNWKSQLARFRLLRHIKPVLKGMQYYQEYMESLEEVKTKQGKKTTLQSKVITYWGFVAIIENKIRIKIVLRRIGNGKIHFWSIIPIWKTKQYKDVRTISLHKGNLAED